MVRYGTTVTFYPIAMSTGNPADEGLYPDGAAAEASRGWSQQSRGGQVRRGGEALPGGGQGEIVLT